MKSALIFLAVLSVAFGAAIEPKANGTTLPEAFAQIGELMDFEALADVAAHWIENDTEVAAVYNYFNGTNFSAAWDVVILDESLIQFVRWIESTGVDIIGFFNRIAEVYNLTPLIPAQPTPVANRAVANRSWEGFVDAILALYPQEEAHALVTELKLTNPEFAQFLVKFDNLHGALILISELPEVEQVGADLRELGVNIDRLRDALKNFFGWE